jgi:tripartite-type tricarboxylate transporter receptor subunit TctC
MCNATIPIDPYQMDARVDITTMGALIVVWRAASADVAPGAQLVRAGSLKVLGTTSAQRSSYWPQVPTIAEQGMPGFDIEIWFGMYAPAKIPEDIIVKLNAEMCKYLASQGAKDAFARVGMDSAPSTPEELRARIIAEQKVFGKAVKDARLKVE